MRVARRNEIFRKQKNSRPNPPLPSRRERERKKWGKIRKVIQAKTVKHGMMVAFLAASCKPQQPSLKTGQLACLT